MGSWYGTLAEVYDLIIAELWSQEDVAGPGFGEVDDLGEDGIRLLLFFFLEARFDVGGEGGIAVAESSEEVSRGGACADAQFEQVFAVVDGCCVVAQDAAHEVEAVGYIGFLFIF